MSPTTPKPPESPNSQTRSAEARLRCSKRNYEFAATTHQTRRHELQVAIAQLDRIRRNQTQPPSATDTSALLNAQGQVRLARTNLMAIRTAAEKLKGDLDEAEAEMERLKAEAEMERLKAEAARRRKSSSVEFIGMRTRSIAMPGVEDDQKVEAGAARPKGPRPQETGPFGKKARQQFQNWGKTDREIEATARRRSARLKEEEARKAQAAQEDQEDLSRAELRQRKRAETLKKLRELEEKKRKEAERGRSHEEKEQQRQQQREAKAKADYEAWKSRKQSNAHIDQGGSSFFKEPTEADLMRNREWKAKTDGVLVGAHVYDKMTEFPDPPQKYAFLPAIPKTKAGWYRDEQWYAACKNPVCVSSAPDAPQGDEDTGRRRALHTCPHTIEWIFKSLEVDPREEAPKWEPKRFPVRYGPDRIPLQKKAWEVYSVLSDMARAMPKEDGDPIKAWRKKTDAAFTNYSAIAYFPDPPVLGQCHKQACILSKNERSLTACPCDIQSLFETLGVVPKEERVRWHPDRFAGSRNREDFQRKANEVFLVLNQMAADLDEQK